jgi:Tfp pilus assembly protein PilO
MSNEPFYVKFSRCLKVGKLDRIVNVVDISMLPVKEYDTNLRTICKTVTYRFKEQQETKSATNDTKKK